MNKKNKGSSGVITVMASLLLIPLLAFGTVVMEMGRFVSARQTLADAQITASMAVLANYNTYLFERFGILAIDPAIDVDAVYSEHLKYNSDAEGGNSSRLYNLDSSIDCESIYNLSEYAVLKRQVLEYSKYSVPYSYLSNKLDIKSLFSKFTSKINGVTDYIKEMSDYAEQSVTELEKAFYSIGRVEATVFDAKNYLGSSYSKDSYVPKDLYDDYVKPNDNLDGKGVINGIGVYTGFLAIDTLYSEKYDPYISAIKDKIKFLNENPDPQPTLNKAKALKLENYDKDEGVNPLSKAAIKTVLKALDDSSKLPEDPLPATVKVYYKNVNSSYSYSLDNETVSITVNKNSSSNYKTVNVVSAIRTIDPTKKNSTEVESWTYADLKQFASNKGLNNTAEKYAEQYSNSLYNDAWESQRSSLVSELETAKTNYDTNLAKKNTAIDNAKGTYANGLGAAYTKFETYAKALETSVSVIGEALKAFDKTVEYEDSNSAELGSNSSEIKTNLNKVIETFTARATAAREAMALIDSIKLNVQKISGSQISSYSYNNNIYTVNYTVGSKSETAQVGIDTSALNGKLSTDFEVVKTAFNTKAIDTGDVELVGDDPLKNLESMTSSVDEALNISKIWESFKQIIQILDPIPKAYDSEYNMEISQYSIDKLPKLTVSDTDGYYTKDEAYVNKLMQNSGYDAKPEPAGTDSNDFRSQVEGLFSDDDKDDDKDKEKGTVNEIYGNADSNKSLGLGKMIVKIKKIIKTVVTVLDTLASLMDKIKSMIMSIGEAVFTTVLINGYITQKFPSRMTSIADSHMVPVGKGQLENDSYFNSCCVEYCIFGDTSEIDNQKKTFWFIFGVRAVINCVQLLTTSETMSLVSSCNIFAPLMFIALLYMETNIDMNYLITLGEPVPVWKDHVHMSSQGIADIVGELVEFDTTKVRIAKSGNGKRYHVESGNCHMLTFNANGTVETEVKKMKDAAKLGYTPCKVCNPKSNPEEESNSDGVVPLSYDNYLYILLLMTGNDKKLQHLANLIQLETRYYEVTTQKSTEFRIDAASTYTRSVAKASYNTMLPMFSLGSSGNSFPELSGLEYVGY